MKPGRKAQKLGRDELFQFAVKSLSIRANSTEELRTKLRRKASVMEDVDATITRLKEIGYLNDARFAESFATARRDNNGFGKYRVLLDLQRRRVSAPAAQKAVSQAYSDTSEPELITSFIERRLPLIAAGRVSDEKQLAAAYRKLRRAGFATAPVILALKRFAARPEEIEEPDEDEETAADE